MAGWLAGWLTRVRASGSKPRDAAATTGSDSFIVEIGDQPSDNDSQTPDAPDVFDGGESGGAGASADFGGDAGGGDSGGGDGGGD